MDSNCDVSQNYGILKFGHGDMVFFWSEKRKGERIIVPIQGRAAEMNNSRFCGPNNNNNNNNVRK